jgi:RNA polymerase sigma-70 factor (sigma-E family)
MMSSEAGVQDRVAVLFDHLYLPLCRLAALLLGDASVAEDVVQEAFLRTFSGWARIRDPERAEHYLRRSVVNLCRSRFRHREVEHRGNCLVGNRDERENGRRSWDSDRQDTVVVVLEAVRRLPPRQRMTIVLRYYLDLTEAEVAKLMGCSTGTVKSQVTKAKAALALNLDPPGATSPPQTMPSPPQTMPFSAAVPPQAAANPKVAEPRSAGATPLAAATEAVSPPATEAGAPPASEAGSAWASDPVAPTPTAAARRATTDDGSPSATDAASPCAGASKTWAVTA